MNILFCPSDNDKASGAFRSMVKLASLLQDDFGCNILVLIPRAGNGVELLNNAGIRWFYVRTFNWTVSLKKRHRVSTAISMRLKMAYNRFSISKIRKIISKNSIDIVHMNTSWTYAAAIAAFSNKIKVIWHIREFLEEDQKRCFYNAEYAFKLMNKSNKIIAISESIKGKYATYFDNKRLVRVYNGIDVEHFYQGARKILSMDRFRFLIVGRVCNEKGQIELLKACAEIKNKLPGEFHLDIVGSYDLEYKLTLDDLIKKEGLIDLVTFHGFCDDTRKFYQLADIVFVCSKAEAFGRVTVEAMLSGALVIGANTAGTKELVKDGHTGLLYQYGSPHNLADKIVYACSNADIVRGIAQQGQEYMCVNMSAEVNAKEIYEIYRSQCEE